MVNPGVLIEYGILVGLEELYKLSLFCDQSFNRQRLSPLFHGRDIQAFIADDEGTQLKGLVRPILEDYMRYAIDRLQSVSRRQRVTNQFLGYMFADRGTQTG